MSYYLYEHENRSAPRRTNGIRGWFYPSRLNGAPDLICLHSAENTPDYIGEDGGAEAVAAYQATTDRPSSYHVLVDSDSTIQMLPDEAVAFGAVGANARGIHLSVATRAALWAGKPDWWRDAAVARLAVEVAARAVRWGIPLRRLTRDEYLAGYPGLVAHADVDPGRRSDPGAAFPWDVLLTAAASLLDPAPEEDDMYTDDDRARDDRTAADVAKCKGALGRIEVQLDGRLVSDDLSRLRTSLRAVGRKLGLKVDLNGRPGEDVTS